MATIGMVGVGAMGAPMARNLLEAGHGLKVHDLAPAAVDGLVADGAQRAAADDVARDVDVVLTMLRHGDIVEQVLVGASGLFAQAAPGTLFIDCSTIAVGTARALSARAAAAGMRMVEAPVSGGVPGAEAATLTFMAAGDEADVARARPILEAMGRAIVHVGPAGAGQAAKICNNMILGVSMIAVAEAFRLAEGLGLDSRTLQSVVSASSGDCWVVHHNHPVPGLVPTSASNDDFRHGFTCALMHKDLGLSQSAARDVGAATPMGAKAAELYGDFVEAGHGELDFGAIIRQLDGGDR